MASSKFFCFLFFIVIVNSAIGQKCKGGAECVLLESCSGLSSNLKQSYQPILLKLTRRLFCGFEEHDKPKVCCPPELRSQPNPELESNITSRTGEYLEFTSASDPDSMLPDFTVCGIQEKKFSGNARTELGEHPWIALLRFDKPSGWGFYCGGVLISSKYVLTSASCVNGNNLPSTWNLTQVRLGEWNTSSTIDYDRGFSNIPPQDVPVEQIIVHEHFNAGDENQLNDIALLRLGQKVQFSDFIKPICLPTIEWLKVSMFEGYIMEIAGWGETGSRAESDVKLKAKMSLVEKPVCSKLFHRLGRLITSKQLCAGEANGNNRCAVSGGALMVHIPIFENWMAVGVMSYGPSVSGIPRLPNVYTQVGPYVDWITSKLKP